MPRPVDLTLDRQSIIDARDGLVRQVLGAGTTAIREATRELEKDFEEATRNAVPGRLWRAWASRAYPKRGIARAPVGEVYINGDARSRGAMAFFTMPGQIRGKSGQFLAIPTAAAGARGRDRNLTPGEWERRNGTRLRFVYRPGRPSLLVLDKGRLSGKKQIGAVNRRGQNDATIVIFVLLPVVKFANRVALGPMIQRAQGDLVARAQQLLAQGGMNG